MGSRVLELELMGSELKECPTLRAEGLLGFPRRGVLPDGVYDDRREDCCKDIITDDWRLWGQGSIQYLAITRLINDDKRIFASTAPNAPEEEDRRWSSSRFSHFEN